MIRRTALLAALALAPVVPLPSAMPALAQDAAPACAGAVWLEPLGADETDDSGLAEITEPAPAWLTIELTDACSGETFTLADFSGKTLFIEPMATWCVTCHEQLTRVAAAVAQIPEEERGEIVLVALSSEVGLPREDLAGYVAENDFPFIFAVMPEEMLRAMVDDLGREIAVPPATPHLIVAPDGTIGELRSGSTSPEDLLTLFAEARPATTP